MTLTYRLITIAVLAFVFGGVTVVVISLLDRDVGKALISFLDRNSRAHVAIQPDETQEQEEDQQDGLDSNSPSGIKHAAESIIRSHLREPSSGIFRHLVTFRVSDDGYIVCGELNSKNGFGGFTGYVPFWAAVFLSENSALIGSHDFSDFRIANDAESATDILRFCSASAKRAAEPRIPADPLDR
jgi:hypothetical protein